MKKPLLATMLVAAGVIALTSAVFLWRQTPSKNDSGSFEISSPSPSKGVGEGVDDNRGKRLLELTRKVNVLLARAAAAAAQQSAAVPPPPSPGAAKAITLTATPLPVDEAMKLRAEVERTLSGQGSPSANEPHQDMLELLTEIRATPDGQRKLTLLSHYVKIADHLTEDSRIQALADLAEIGESIASESVSSGDLP